MQMSAKTVTKWVLAAGFVASFALTGCTKRPNQEQLQLLEETTQAAMAAEQKSEQCASDKSSVAGQLDNAKGDLQKAQDEREAVKTRLGM
jgi:outer membrane murein-binding lipoprotein Lpp